jgi:alpha-amylase
MRSFPGRHGALAGSISTSISTSLLALLALSCGPLAAPRPAAVAAAAPPALQALAVPGSFTENPIVYFVVTDRFANGDPKNDHSYGRMPDGGDEIGTFHGGDLAGLTQKLDDGYFRDLGVNAIWITAPYQQMLGWVVGGNKEFRHYGYHGYYALDYTVLDANMGTEHELRRMIDTAHRQGIRVLFDVVMNHPGYADLRSLTTYGVDVVWKGWENATPADYGSYIDYNNPKFTSWWGPAWIRSDLAGYTSGGGDDFTKQLSYLPDFRTESTAAVDLPPFLRKKPDTKAVAHPNTTVRGYLVEWLTRWVRDFGVDGFRCDTVKHVEPEAWQALKTAGLAALAEWKRAHPHQAIDDSPFWMTAEVFPHDVSRDAIFDHGFDNVINFDFQARAQALLADDWRGLDALYTEYAAALHAGAPFNVLSYLSSHDTSLFPRQRLIEGTTKLLLAPGGVQLFYGDETGRPIGPSPSTDPQQGTRSSMNWGSVDAALLAHVRLLTSFRQRHVALAMGTHQKLSDKPYTFARQRADGADGGDRVVVALGASGPTTITVGDVMPEGAQLRDASTGLIVQVHAGAAQVTAAPSGIVLLERIAPAHSLDAVVPAQR